MLEWFRSMSPAQNFVLTSVYTAGIALLGIGAFFGLTKGGNAMVTATVTSAVEVKIPAIDVNAPTETETATFSLG